MKCPKCGNPRYKYVHEKKVSGEREKKKYSRETPATKCNKCGYET